MSGFKVAAAAAYDENSTDPSLLASGFTIGDTDKYFQVGAYVEHVATGLFAYGAYGHNDSDLTTGTAETFYGKAGLRERWNSLGHTVLYGEYEKTKNDGFMAVNGTSDSAGSGAVVSSRRSMRRPCLCGSPIATLAMMTTRPSAIRTSST